MYVVGKKGNKNKKRMKVNEKYYIDLSKGN